MSIWSRFTRFIRSIFGGVISAMEDPKLILEQNIREMNDQVPKMNENIATVKANVVLLQKEVQRSEHEIASLTSKVKAAIQAGRELRVIVDCDKISDEMASSLSFEISHKIQTEMTYPGQVKVTVIRETRAVNIAR